MDVENNHKDPARPDPDALLKEVERDEGKKGVLKIFLGYAPGVGKTYAMLSGAHVLKNRGEDVAVGIVETHKRAETEELVKGLEVIPRRRVEYQGIVLEELDVDGLIVHHEDRWCRHAGISRSSDWAGWQDCLRSGQAPSRWRYAFSVFFINMATVIGPTPPGTGVILPASGATDGKCTSPTRR